MSELPPLHFNSRSNNFDEPTGQVNHGVELDPPRTQERPTEADLDNQTSPEPDNDDMESAHNDD